ncbi:MAG: hypothetical protein KJ000_22430 [Pirellulaceae bacterium]|nr:hypothetical protein [Pirellulaceae bacterium]
MMRRIDDSTKFRSAIMRRSAALWFVLLAAAGLWCAAVRAAEISFTLDKPGRTSLAVYSADGAVQYRALLVGEHLQAGTHAVPWDGLDRDGRPLAPGSYQWKLVTGPGIEATFLDSLGTNPKAGPWARWIGNHTGPSAIAVGPQGICVGAPIAEGPPNIHFFEPDFATTRWFAPHYGWSAVGHRALAMIDRSVVSLSQDAHVSLFDVQTGDKTKSFDVLWAGDQRPDAHGGRELYLDALGERFAVSYRHHDAVRWFDLDSGNVVREVRIAKPRCIALRADGSTLVLGESGIVRVDADDRPTVVVAADQLVHPAVLAWDASNRTMLVANGAPDNRILRFSDDGRLLKSYGIAGGRKPGPYSSDRFAEVADIAPDSGRFYVVEGGDAGDGLRRIALVGNDGAILDERFGGAEFFSCAAPVPGNPREVYYSPCPDLIGRYDLDPETGRSRLTHLFANTTWGFPSFATFPHYRPVVRKGHVYLVSNGRFIVRPDLERGELIPVALADHRPWGGWKDDAIPEPIAQAAAHHGIDPQSDKANAFTWSDTNGNGRMDAEEFRFHSSGPRRGYAFLDDDFNALFGYYHAWNHTYDEVNKRWMGFDFDKSLYATLPNTAPDDDAPVWDWSRVVLSAAKIPEDPLGLWQRLASCAVHKSAEGRIDVFFSGGGGTHADTHPHPWPTAQTTGTRIVSAIGDRVVQVVGKHASEGPPRDTQFGQPSHLLGTVGGNRIVCDRMEYTTAWTPDGLFIGMLLERPDYGTRPKVHCGVMGDDWMSAGSIADLGNGQALWFPPSGDRAMVFRVRGFDDLQRQSGTVVLQTAPPAAALDGEGLKADYFASADLVGQPIVSRIDPRLWFYDGSKSGQIVAAWAANGPCEGIAAGQSFSARWTGSVTAPLTEPFWLRVYNTRPGRGHTPSQQAWQDGKGFVRVWLNDQLVLDKWDGSPETNPWQTPPLMLQAEQRYDLKVKYAYPGGSDAQFSLVWCSKTLEWMRVPTPYLHPEPAPSRPRVSVASIQPSAGEERDKLGAIRFTLDASHDRDIAIKYRLSGTASADDYTIDGDPAIIRAGQTSADLVIRPIDDDLIEANETVRVTLAPSPQYAGDGTAGEAVVTIVDNDNVLIGNDLVVYYTFDNASLAVEQNFATVRNEAGPDHALRIQSYMHSMPILSPGPAKYGQGLNFPEGRENVRSSGTLDLGDFTDAFWFRSPEPTVGICTVGAANFSLVDGRLHVVNGGWPSTQPPGADLADGRWHHAALTWSRDQRQMQLFVDGAHVATNTGAQGSGLSGQIQLGRAHTGGPFLGGTIDELRVYSRRLTPDEIQTLFGAREEDEPVGSRRTARP